MKGSNSWNYTPYIPLNESCFQFAPYIVSIAPFKTGFTFEWLKAKDGYSHTITIKEKGGKKVTTLPLDKSPFTVTGLKENTDYEFFIESEKEQKSKIRLVYTAEFPGNVINYLHPQDTAYTFSGKYLCSPSIVKYDENKYLLSMDVFGRKMPQNHTLIFRSIDGGETWNYVTEIHPCFWGKLFVHNGEIYLLGVSTQYGSLVIGKSLDQGETWSKPSIIFTGGAPNGEGYHRAPCVIEKANGRLWTSVEYGSWYFTGFSNSVLSIDENADLLNGENWVVSQGYNHGEDIICPEDGMVTGVFQRESKKITIEGNVLTMPNGELVNFLRYKDGKAVLLSVDKNQPEKQSEFFKEVDFTLADTKFEIQKHSNGKYYAIGNDSECKRSKLSIYSSLDLIEWKRELTVLDYSHMDDNLIGFQYPVFTFEDYGFLVISRTAFNKADCYHDSNCISVHKVIFDFNK